MTETHVITDHADDQVSVPTKINRIAVVGRYPLPSVLAIFFNSAEKIVGMPKASMAAAKHSLLADLYPEILQAKTDFVQRSQIDIEKLKALEPDVVFYSSGNNVMKTQLKDGGLTAVAVSNNRWHYDAIETLNQWIALFNQLFPENSKANLVRDYSQKIYDQIQAKVKDLTAIQRQKLFFLFQYDANHITTSSFSFFGQYWATAIGAFNSGAVLRKDNATEVDFEQVQEWQPNDIFITNFNRAQPDDLYHNTIGPYDWSGIDAIQRKRVYKMPLGMYRSFTPGVDTPITLQWLAKTVYPQVFKDLDLAAEAKDYYMKVFGIVLTDAQIDQMFHPVSDASAY